MGREEYSGRVTRWSTGSEVAWRDAVRRIKSGSRRLASGSPIHERAVALNWRKTASPSAMPPARIVEESPNAANAPYIRSVASPRQVISPIRTCTEFLVSRPRSIVRRTSGDWPTRFVNQPPRTCQVQSSSYFFFFPPFFAAPPFFLDDDFLLAGIYRSPPQEFLARASLHPLASKNRSGRRGSRHIIPRKESRPRRLKQIACRLGQWISAKCATSCAH
jgi:hypothetical protein